MAYTDDSVLARLSALNESHDSIATAAQWIMFHRRHADRTVQLWLQRLKDSSASKRLSLMYLANEVAQQSRIRHKEDFITAFAPIIAEAVAIAYKGAPVELQNKLRRVLDVWRERSIFEAPIQAAINSRLEELDKARGTPKSGFGNSPFSGNAIPTEFAKVIAQRKKAQTLATPLQATIASAQQEYEKQTDTSVAVPSAPVYAARLNGLLKTLANAEHAVAECVKTREELVAEMEAMLAVERSALQADTASAASLAEKKQEIEKKKEMVEVAIMQALGPASNGEPVLADGQPENASSEPNRPEMEALTPPSVEPLSPIDAPSPGAGFEAKTGQPRSMTINTNGSNKRRRVEDSGDFPDLGPNDGIDADVAEMLETTD
ncbi:hypothetical protein VHEMI10115 [[Torrubiella] hemipterigena]|uniref:CID domain-containing protein n=1 Tax=[Torrubiella] hemipterigena TaxID=1531966 RepID=A0A0A1TBZ5_9HYPO|nr:hypothetical protein VHEMI10115 [[Torrubiella] hemipterigena]